MGEAVSYIGTVASRKALQFNNWANHLVMGDDPKPPPIPDQPKAAPEMQDEVIRNAKLMERRRQLGLAGRGSTWLTGARGDTTPVVVGQKTLLGG